MYLSRISVDLSRNIPTIFGLDFDQFYESINVKRSLFIYLLQWKKKKIFIDLRDLNESAMDVLLRKQEEQEFTK